MLRLLQLTMFIFLLSISLTDPIKNVFAENHGLGITIDQIFLHPLLLLLIGGAVSGYIIPRETKRWQARREIFEIKSQLITKINKSATTLLVELEFITRKENPNEKLIHNIFLEWRETAAEIGATVRTYWHAKNYVNPVLLEWNTFFDIVKDLYNIVLNINMEKVDINRKKLFMKTYLESNPENEVLDYDPEKSIIALDNFFEALDKKDKKELRRCVPELLFYVDKRKYYLLTLIFKEPTTSYDSFFKFKK